ncbi:MAG: GNAT family N-acetyltransferase [Flavobacteriales bacterium]|nr:GNAT family N-acetyltransferase [Flavobacteriales bacterium]
MNIELRDIALADANRIAEWKSDAELSEQIMSNFQLTSVTMATEWIKINTAHTGQLLKGIYAELQDGFKLIGVSRLMFIDVESRNAELGIYIGDNKYQGKGIGEKALGATLEMGFKELELLKIYLKVASKETRAIGLYSKLNFKIEGCLKDHYYSNGVFQKIIFMALFREDYL